MPFGIVVAIVVAVLLLIVAAVFGLLAFSWKRLWLCLFWTLALAAVFVQFAELPNTNCMSDECAGWHNLELVAVGGAIVLGLLGGWIAVAIARTERSRSDVSKSE